MRRSIELWERNALARPAMVFSCVVLGLVSGLLLTQDPTRSVGLAVGAAVGVVAIRHPMLALTLFLAQVPFSSPLLDGFFPAKLQGGRPFFVLLVASILHAAVFRRTQRRPVAFFDVALAGYLVLTVASLLRTLMPLREAFDLYLATILIPIGVVFCVRFIRFDASDVDRILDLLAGCAMAVAGFLVLERVLLYNVFNPGDALAGWNALSGEATYRVSGPFVNPNNAGAFLVMGMAVLARRRGSRLVTPWWVWAGLGLGSVALFFTISRAAYLAAALVGVIYALHRGRASVLGAVVAVVAVVVLAGPWAVNSETVQSGVMNPSSMIYRLSLLEAAGEMLTAGPGELFLGHGFENFRFLSSDYAPWIFAPVMPERGAGMPVHNDVLALVIHMGLVGFVVFSSLVLCVIRTGSKLRKRALAAGDIQEADRIVALMAIGVVQLVFAMSHVPFATHQLATLFWLASALLVYRAPGPFPEPRN